MDFTNFSVGERVMRPGPDQVIFDMSDSGGTLAICMARPTGEERRAFKAGLTFKFAVEEQIIFLLVGVRPAQYYFIFVHDPLPVRRPPADVYTYP